VGVDGAAHEGGERLPRVALVVDAVLGEVDVGLEPDRAQAPDQVVLAGVAAVQRAHAHAGGLGDGGHGGAGVGQEHRPGGGEDRLVVAGRLGLAAAQRGGRGRCHALTLRERSVPIQKKLERSAPFR
jgi:hypothetical protein